jgi:hypothetical protein
MNSGLAGLVDREIVRMAAMKLPHFLQVGRLQFLPAAYQVTACSQRIRAVIRLPVFVLRLDLVSLAPRRVDRNRYVRPSAPSLSAYLLPALCDRIVIVADFETKGASHLLGDTEQKGTVPIWGQADSRFLF